MYLWPVEHFHQFFGTSSTKGQLMSKCIFEIINFSKYHRKNICPGRFYRLGMYMQFIFIILKTATQVSAW